LWTTGCFGELHGEAVTDLLDAGMRGVRGDLKEEERGDVSVFQLVRQYHVDQLSDAKLTS
jgi:hypothetical protein